uniref:Ig-like domain-containing protein n=1 Tax=Salarias fasciatus TaxID=181472 RepID=A0A672JJQ4_SALFA
MQQLQFSLDISLHFIQEVFIKIDFMLRLLSNIFYQYVVSEIKCSHKIPSYNHILWYKQGKDKALQLLGYLNLNSVNVESEMNGKISFIGDGRNDGSLSISDLRLNDSAVYFCAASLHSAAHLSGVKTKTS